MSLGKKIKEHRQHMKLSQLKLAEKLNVTQSAVSKWELDIFEPDSETLKKLAQYFGTSTDELLNYRRNTPEMTKETEKKELLKAILEQTNTSVMFASGSTIDELDEETVDGLLEELTSFLDVKVGMKSKEK